MRTRSNVVTLIEASNNKDNPDWPDALLSYQKGVAAMRAKDPVGTNPPVDHLSWQYLAAVHGRPTMGKKGPALDESDPLWSKCQHGSWFFFPWHRMYLLTLESFIRHFSGDADWSVPYWYAVDPDTPKSDVLPNAFLDASGGNALYVKERSTFAQAGQPIFGSVIWKLLSADFITNLGQRIFSVSQDAVPIDNYFGFGGAEYNDQNFNHGHNGAIESIPHAWVHNYVGNDFDRDGNRVGPEGFMSDLMQASRDPIFYLHHANIDRLWQMWLDLDPAHKNSHDNDWLTSSFTFPTPDGGTQQWEVQDVLDTTELGYVYDTVAPPTKFAAAPVGRGPAAQEVVAKVSAPTPAQRPEVIGATVRVPLIADHRADIPLSAPSAPSRALAPDSGAPARHQWLLSLEGITGTVSTSGYGVYVNVPPGAVAAEHPELLAGIVSTFGVRSASLPRGQHGGSGLTFVFDITGVHDALEADGRWDPGNVNVVFVPLVPPVTDEAALAERRAAAPPSTPDLQVTRIAVLVR